MPRAVVFISTVQNPEEPLTCSNQSIQFVEENEIINDFDLIALEKAIQLKEAGYLDEIVVFSLSPSQKTLLKPLAMGADRAIWGKAENAVLTPEIVVQTALDAIADDGQTLWMTGKMGVNFESHQTAQILSAKLGIPCLMSTFQIEFSNNQFHISCEDDKGIAHYHLPLPFVVTAELRLAEPRFPGLPSIIRAKRKPVEEIHVSSGSIHTIDMTLSKQNYRKCRFMTEDEFYIEMHQIIGGKV